MKTTFAVILALVIGALTPIAAEIAMVMWLANAPFDVTGRLFLLGILPIQILLVGIGSVVLTLPYRWNLKRYASLYAATHASVYAALLMSLGNPWPDIALYLLGVVLAHGLWISFAYRRVTRI